MKNIWEVIKHPSFWQKLISLVLIPSVMGILIVSLIAIKVEWFAALVFVVGILYFMFALMLNDQDKDFEAKLLGGWISIRQHEKES